MESTSFRFSSRFFFFIIAVIAGYSDVVVGVCQYSISVQTGSIKVNGTFTVSLILGDNNGEKITIPNLAEWGLEGPSYPYFQEGKLDHFSGRDTCISVCNIIVASKGTAKYGWPLTNVVVDTTGRRQITFDINQLLDFSSPIAQRNLCGIRAEGAGSANRKVHANKRSGSAFDIVRAWE